MSAVEMSICQADRGCMFTMNCCRCVSITHISCPGIMRASNNHISCPWDNELIQHTISFQCHKRLQTIKSVHSERKNQCSQQGCFRTMTFFHQPANACRWTYSMPNVVNITTLESSYCRAICPGVGDEQYICDTTLRLHSSDAFGSLYICHTLIHLADSQGVHRVWDKAMHVEVEWTVGPIPIHDKKGKEVVLRYASSLQSGQNSNLLTHRPCITCL